MSMEPFDYLTYKQNKNRNKQENNSKKDKLLIGAVCFATFACIFIFVMMFIASKSSKIDIEYGRLGRENISETGIENNEEYDSEETGERFTIDKRLFLIRQEEKGPSESRVVKQDDRAEVISKEEFDLLKTNNEQVVKTAEKQLALKPQTVSEQAGKTEDIIVPDNIQEKTVAQSAQTSDTRAAIKPKLPVNPGVQTMSSFSVPVVPSKVLIGRFQTPEEARSVQASLTGLVDGTIPFIRKINIYYTVQVGSYENFDAAKTVASKLKLKGYDVWILQ